ncbi:hypothetical protein TRFO_39256 [Tritrichomonas foetus]|uniref:Uncharacterized protein n=1 Tax=Tritrichomonas foetus TaxID=1144522 RepID=A0A1J4JBD9_9EUKA|nr:hypothetical protein TRFO_39256 [Tritrichomonas foetus]|eukprot:OHS94564.1 hypothetical protein TRFO_39256 [Tritrichomonas foetus]
MDEIRPIFLHQLLVDKLFENNHHQYALSCFPKLSTENVLNQILCHSNKDIFLEDETRIKWLLQVMPFAFLQNDEKLVDIAIHHFYLKLLTSNIPNICENNLDIFNMYVQYSFLHLSLLFENSTFIKQIPQLILSLKNIIKKESNEYTISTWYFIFKVIIGICNFTFSTSSPFLNESFIQKQICKLLFRVLIFSNEKTDCNWELFNQFSKDWNYQYYFCSIWKSTFQKYFNFLTHPYEEKKSMSIIINFLKNAKNIYYTPNSCILHEAFVVIANIVQQQNIPFSKIFEHKYVVDTVFSIFAVWPLAPGNESTKIRSVNSLIELIEKSSIKENSTWFSATIEYFIREMKDKNTNITQNFLPKIGRIICSHPQHSTRLVLYLMKFFSRQMVDPSLFFQINDINTISLVITITETILQKHDEGGTIESVYQLLPRMLCYQWQYQLFLIMVSGSYDLFWSEISNILQKDETNLSFLPYLMILPQFGNQFFTKGSSSKTVINNLFYKMISKPNNVLVDNQIALIYSCIEISRNSNLFFPLSAERELLFKLLESINCSRELCKYLLLTMCPQSPPADPSVVNRLEKNYSNFSFHYCLKGSVITCIECEELPFTLIIRNSFGSFCFEFHDFSSPIQKCSDVQTSHINEQDKSYHIEKPVQCKELLGAFHDSLFLKENNGLTEINKPIKFSIDTNTNESSKNIKGNIISQEEEEEVKREKKVISILARLGVITSGNISNISKINHDISDFIDEFDSIPGRDLIEVGIIHYTNKNPYYPGDRNRTSSFNQFMNDIGRPIDNYMKFEARDVVSYILASSQIVYISRHMVKSSLMIHEYMNLLPVLIVFNETSYRFTSDGFEGYMPSLVIGIELKSIGLYRIDILKSDESIPYPFMKGLPQLVSKRNLAASISLCVLLTVFNNYKRIFGVNRACRANALKKVVFDNVSTLGSFFK